MDRFTQRQLVVCTEQITHSFMRTVMERPIEQFPFTVLGIHAENGSECINTRMRELMENARIELNKSRPGRSTDNALVEGKNGAVVRKMFGFVHIAKSRAGLINAFNQEHFNPLNNLHRPCLLATLRDDPAKPGRTRRHYAPEDARTPLEKLESLPAKMRHLKRGVTLKGLKDKAREQTYLQAAQPRPNTPTYDLKTPRILEIQTTQYTAHSLTDQLGPIAPSPLARSASNLNWIRLCV